MLKTRILGHFKLREFHESSTEYPFLPYGNPFLSTLSLKKKKKQKNSAQAKGNFYLKPGEWVRNAVEIRGELCSRDILLLPSVSQ